MELSKFNELASKSTNDAKNFISFLIGYFCNLPRSNFLDYQEAILSVYDNFSDDIKKDKKAFAPIFYKYFNTFLIDARNENYYKDYESFWTDSSKQIIRSKNPNWNWESPKFKNSLEYTKSLGQLYYNRRNECPSFIKETHSEIMRLIDTKKTKDKFMQNMYKNRCWHGMVKYNFDLFKQFCVDYDFNEKEILTELIKFNYTGLGEFICYDKSGSNQTIMLFNELVKYDLTTFFNDTDFFKSCNYKKSKNYYNLLDLFIALTNRDMWIEGMILLDNYPEEMKECIKPYLHSNTVDIHDPKMWDELLKELDKTINGYNTRTALNISDIHILKQNTEDIVRYIKRLALKNSLESMDNKNTHVPSMKI